MRRMKFPKVAYLPFGKCSAVSAGYAKRNEVQRSMSCGNFEFFYGNTAQALNGVALIIQFRSTFVIQTKSSALPALLLVLYVIAVK